MERPNADRFAGITYGLSPAMDALPSVELINRIKQEWLERIQVRADMKKAYAILADW
jgi:hypothetical protein